MKDSFRRFGNLQGPSAMKYPGAHFGLIIDSINVTFYTKRAFLRECYFHLDNYASKNPFIVYLGFFAFFLHWHAFDRKSVAKPVGFAWSTFLAPDQEQMVSIIQCHDS